MNFNDWVESLPPAIKNDSLWKMEAYRLALFATEIGWHDVAELMKDKRTLGIADQLYRALGSAREARDWYYKSHHILKEEVINHRINFLTQIIKLLLTMIPQQRGKRLSLKEEQAAYTIDILTNTPF